MTMKKERRKANFFLSSANEIHIDSGTGQERIGIIKKEKLRRRRPDPIPFQRESNKKDWQEIAAAAERHHRLHLV